METYNDPQIQAESLLMTVLPRKAYLALSATGECVVDGKKNTYCLSRNRKTMVTSKNGERFSACIVFADEGHDITENQFVNRKPPQDRLVMEYLLIRSDEERYLATAILTPMQPVRSGAALRALRDDTPPLYPRRAGDTIQIRYPPQYVGRRAIDVQDITAHAMLRVKHHALLQGRRFTNILYPDTREARARVQSSRVHMDIQGADLLKDIDRFMAEHLHEPADALAGNFAQQRVDSVVELPLYPGVVTGRTTDLDTGLSVHFARGFDITQNLFLSNLRIAFIEAV